MVAGISKVVKCEVCHAGNLEQVLNLGTHPMCDDLIPVGQTIRPKEYPIAIGFCNTCRTAHQLNQIPKETLFPQSYHYRARHTADVLLGMRKLADRCSEIIGPLKDKLVLDVGCNDGSLLTIFGEHGAKTVGIEPTGASEDALAAGHRVYHDYLTPALADRIIADFGAFDVITFTNVFAHIEDLPLLLKAVSILASSGSLLIIENHYLGAVVDRYQFDTFYHEHPRTYSLTSFQYIARSLGGSILSAEFPARYGGNIRVMISLGGSTRSKSLLPSNILDQEDQFRDRLVSMGQKIPLWQQYKKDSLDRLSAKFGPLAGKAFPGRAAILVKLLGLDVKNVSAVHEKPNSMKIGHYLPGTGIPIRSDSDFDLRNEAPLLNLAWHIPDEIHSYMRGRGFRGEIVDIFSAKEFELLS